jgi:hypothetical protein
VDAAVVWLFFFFGLGLSTLLALCFLLLLALALLHLELSALFPVAGALVMELVVLGYNLGFAAFAVATAASTGLCVSKM